ncbi:MAG TPA: hypothetical protein VGN81_39830 [Pseudonocardiaceae bacterium]|jgi:hypothetical protein
MGAVLPGALAWVLDMIGIEWPTIDEDELRSAATELRSLAGEVDGNTSAAKALRGRLADDQLPQLSEGLKLIATGLDVSAGLVEGVKVDAVVQLGILAGEIIADQAAAPFTFGASELAISGEVEVTSQIVRAAFTAVAQQVEQTLLNAIEGPIFSASGDEFVQRLVGDALGTDVGAIFSAGQQGPSSSVTGDPSSVVGIPA